MSHYTNTLTDYASEVHHCLLLNFFISHVKAQAAKQCSTLLCHTPVCSVASSFPLPSSLESLIIPIRDYVNSLLQLSSCYTPTQIKPY